MDERLECHVHIEVLSSLMAHLLHVDLLKQCADVDALDEQMDLLLELFVVSLILLVLLDGLRVVPGQDLLFALQSLLLALELREAQLLPDDVLPISRSFSFHLACMVSNVIESLLSRDLEIEHVLALLLLLFELFQHHF